MKLTGLSTLDISVAYHYLDMSNLGNIPTYVQFITIDFYAIKRESRMKHIQTTKRR